MAPRLSTVRKEKLLLSQFKLMDHLIWIHLDTHNDRQKLQDYEHFDSIFLKSVL